MTKVAASKERVNKCYSVRTNIIPLFDLMLYVPVNNSFSVMSRQVFLDQTSTKQELMCLAQVHTAVRRVRLEPATP